MSNRQPIFQRRATSRFIQMPKPIATIAHTVAMNGESVYVHHITALTLESKITASFVTTSVLAATAPLSAR